MLASINIESYVNSHIGFDPDYEVIKYTGPASNGTPINRITWFFVIVEQAVKNDQFHVC